jgi:hypothetical protein
MVSVCWSAIVVFGWPCALAPASGVDRPACCQVPGSIEAVAAEASGGLLEDVSGGGMPRGAGLGEDIRIIGRWDGTTCGTGADVWGDGNYAYYGHFGNACVDVLDITDPTNPTFVSSYIPPGEDIGASTQDVKVHDGIGFVAYESDAHNGCGIVDFRDPANPRQLTTVRILADGIDYNTIHNLFYHEGYLYLADSRRPNFTVVDLTNYDPDNPPSHISTAKWHVRNVGTQFVHDITVQDDRLYASAWSHIVVFDISNIANEPPRMLGSAPGQSTHSAWATADHRYIAVGEERSAGPVKLYKAEDDGQGGLDVTLVDQVALSSSSHNPLIVGERVYTAWYGAGMLVHEIDRQTDSLVEVGRVDPGNCWGVYPLLGLDRIILGGFDNFVMVSAQQPQVQVFPTSFEVTRGEFVSGAVGDLFDSDNQYVDVEARRSSELAAASVEIEVTGTALSASPPELTLVTELSTSGDPVRVRIEMFDYDGGFWTVVDERAAPSQDQEIRVTITNTPQRFIADGSLEMKARIGFLDFGVAFPAWGGKYDVVHWGMAP